MFAGLFHLLAQFLHARITGFNLFAELFQLATTRQHTGFLVLLARDTQPVRANPDTITGDNRLAGSKTRAQRQRGSQVSFRLADGYPVMQALIARGVIGDFRAPDILRFGFTPLYTTEAEVRAAAGHLAEILETRAWDRDEFKVRAKVT